MITHLSNDSLQRLLWLQAACSYLMDYRDPCHVITDEERKGLAAYLDTGITSADAAELFQAASNNV